MRDPSGQDLSALYELLLKLAEKEEQALVAENMGELEACLRRKEEIVKKLREIESKKGQDGPSEYSEKLATLLEQVAARHDRVRDGIKAMFRECENAILEIRTGQRAHQAYYGTRKKARERSSRLL